jgi:hypothetical protein
MPRDYPARYERERPVPYGEWKEEHQSWEKESEKQETREQQEKEGSADITAGVASRGRAGP